MWPQRLDRFMFWRRHESPLTPEEKFAIGIAYMAVVAELVRQDGRTPLLDQLTGRERHDDRG